MSDIEVNELYCKFMHTFAEYTYNTRNYEFINNLYRKLIAKTPQLELAMYTYHKLKREIEQFIIEDTNQSYLNLFDNEFVNKDTDIYNYFHNSPICDLNILTLTFQFVLVPKIKTLFDKPCYQCIEKLSNIGNERIIVYQYTDPFFVNIDECNFHLERLAWIMKN